MADAKILVVDDDPGIRRILRVILSRAGYSVSEARDGVEALQIVSDHRYDLITMDLVMDRMDGVDEASARRSSRKTFLRICPWRIGELAEPAYAARKSPEARRKKMAPRFSTRPSSQPSAVI